MGKGEKRLTQKIVTSSDQFLKNVLKVKQVTCYEGCTRRLNSEVKTNNM